MNIVQTLIRLLRDAGFETRYGTAYQINDYLTDVDFSQSRGGTVAYIHLITSLSSVNGRERGEFAVYFARLCDFDFNGEELLDVQQELKGYGEELIRAATCGNEVRVLGNARWQFGYDDFAENVCWVCMRVTLESTTEECVPFGDGCQPRPEPPAILSIVTLPATNIKSSGFTVNAELKNEGGSVILSRCAIARLRGNYNTDNAEFNNPYYYECFESRNCSEQETEIYQVEDYLKFSGEQYDATPFVTAIVDGKENIVYGDAIIVETLPTTPFSSLSIETIEPEVGDVTVLKAFRTIPFNYTMQNGFFLKKKTDEEIKVLTANAGGNIRLEIQLEKGNYVVQSWVIPGTTPYYIKRGNAIEFTIS